MGKLLIVTRDGTPSGPTRRLEVFARAMPPGAVEVCLLGQASPWSRALGESGVPIHAIGLTGLLDLRGRWRLRERTRGAGHLWAWGPGAAWPVVLSGVRPSRLRLVSPLPPGRRPPVALGWLVRRCGVVVADGAAEADALRQLGVEEGRLCVVTPGVEVAAPAPPATLPGLPDDAQVILILGPITRRKGSREAVWAFDILAYLHPRLHLVILGTGPDLAGLRRFVEITGRVNRAHFVGPVADVAAWLARADVVLSAGAGGGRRAILDAMAAGRPVVATRTADRVELLDHGRTGLLAEPGDIPDLCRQVKTILDDGGLGRLLGTNACVEARARFSVSAFVEAMRA